MLPAMLVVTRIERLAGSTFESFAISKRIVGVGGQFWTFVEPWADAPAKGGRGQGAWPALGVTGEDDPRAETGGRPTASRRGIRGRSCPLLG